MVFERWDVVVALFPFSDRPVGKPRPVAILSAGTFNRDHGLVVACMITTASAGTWPSDHPLIDVEPTGLRQPCVVRWKIMTLSSTLVARKIGELASADRNALEEQLAGILPVAKDRN
ncbi:type II toxin-antitoxin system PemK/MazF family toxin [uncultured Enterovirga sp.]|uniref:type II toxin-antitoxin system PemK/MazF family toxin n=1 Tax=uncultured Enterovirga sp. TaxID=2026352 RepID=UPI0035C98E6C